MYHLNDPNLGMGLYVMGIYVVVLFHRFAQITVNNFNEDSDFILSHYRNQNL